MAKTTLKPRAFVFIVSEFSNMNWETRRYFQRSGKHAANVTCRDFARLCCVRLADKLALVAFRLLPRPLWYHTGHWVLWSRMSGTSVCRFKTVPTWWLRGPIKRMRGMLFSSQSTRVVSSSLFSMLSGEIYLRLNEAVFSCWNIFRHSDRTLLSSMCSVCDVLPLCRCVLTW